METYNLPDSSKIEPRFKASLDRYANDKIPTGGFLEAVLENNLSEAFGRADLQSMDNLRHIVAYCYNYLPSACWGSKEKVNNWLKTENQPA